MFTLCWFLCLLGATEERILKKPEFFGEDYLSQQKQAKATKIDEILLFWVIIEINTRISFEKNFEWETGQKHTKNKSLKKLKPRSLRPYAILILLYQLWMCCVQQITTKPIYTSKCIFLISGVKNLQSNKEKTSTWKLEDF